MPKTQGETTPKSLPYIDISHITPASRDGNADSAGEKKFSTA
jgi:hypothetical protein